MTPVIIVVAIIAIATLGGMWLKRRYPKIERSQLATSIAVIVAGMGMMARHSPPSWQFYVGLTLVGIVGTFLYSSWLRPTRT
jgi:type IV secretory pathway VirB2 component (pilin)